MTALVHTSHIASVFGFRYSAFGFRLSAFGLLLAAFGFRLSASGFRLLASSVQLRFRLSAFGFRRLDPQPRTSLRLMSHLNTLQGGKRKWMVELGHVESFREPQMHTFGTVWPDLSTLFRR